MPTTLNQGVTRKCNPSFFGYRRGSRKPMKRRNAIFAGLIALCLAQGRAIAQQPSRVFRIGYLSQPTRESVEPVLQIFLRALRDLGWREGDNIAIEYRWADGHIERLPALAAELVQSEV